MEPWQKQSCFVRLLKSLDRQFDAARRKTLFRQTWCFISYELQRNTGMRDMENRGDVFLEILQAGRLRSISMI